ncbi:phosphoadenylyl-sulfate reductase [Akkermansiaceae bacterium]|nr:phosphoadenylyl-sulfate reductase [Akkermansiaceae bacterium]MDB4809211.1 phosphoadenylyl-sulfate reductase [bacterium]MDA7892228.1 phosphoadenylyl-sulfate reductase [Akkermansiaceae bacterium]MDB4369694.1 phosphoadenylyl-sulfate reductase [Akkermansiaceae bacterium]MDB4384104.1 phosphoadenylyl-sulfate reductase [Akkermansiaceae bacterium]
MKTNQSSAGEVLKRDPTAEELSAILKPLKAHERLIELRGIFGSRLIASSSFGLQASAMLHLIKVHAPDLPIVFIDTGYCFPETYLFAQSFIEDWGLDIRVVNPAISSARQEALYGKLWEQGDEGMKKYSLLNKVEPMNRALSEVGGDVWLSGLRRSQSSTRADRPFAEQQKTTMKVYPILDWPDAQIASYYHEHNLPRHPLEKEGYLTMGDWHSTRKPKAGESARDTRFGGLKYECGLHEDSGQIDYQI